MFFSESSSNYLSGSLNVEASETGLTPDSAGAYRMIAESTEEWYNLREKMMHLEHVAIIREDADLLSEGANDFFKRIADLFKKMLAKVKEIWQKFTTAVSNMVSSDSDFVKKYEKVLRNKSLAGFETKGHSWKTGPLDAGLNFDGLLRQAEGYMSRVGKVRTEADVKSFREEVGGSEFADKARGVVAGGGKPIEQNEFGETVRGTFMNGDTDVQDLSGKDLNIGVMLEIIKNAQKNIEGAQKSQKALEKLLEEAAKFYDGLATRLTAPNSDKKATSTHDLGDGVKSHIHQVDGVSKEKDGHKLSIGGGQVGYVDDADGRSDSRVSMREAATISAGACRQLSTIGSSAFGLLIDGIKSRRSEFRSILARMVTYKAKASEGYEFGIQGNGGILDQF